MWVWLETTLEVLFGYEAGKSSQRSADQQAAQTEVVNALKARAKVDDQVQRAPDSTVVDKLSEWERPGS